MKIAFVASELLGAYKNGGIGTATSHIACFCARSGFAVTVIYTGLGSIDHAHPWLKRLRDAGVAIVHLRTAGIEVYPEWLRESTVVFDYLRRETFDLVLFQDWEGVGFASVVARRAGLAFPNTRLGVFAHGPTEWLLDANRTAARHQRTLAQLHMERSVFHDADDVVCPSDHMREFVSSRFAGALATPETLPLYLWSDPDGDEEARRVAPLSSVRTLAFFGRLEERKGIELFLNAIVSENLAFQDFDVLFVGKAASRTPADIREFAESRRPWLAPRLAFFDDLDSDAAQRLLVERDCLAVIPSLIDNAPCVISECLRRAIPFLSTRTGGIPELVAAADRDRVLVAPNPRALSSRIASIIGQPFAAGAPAYQEDEVGPRWLDWLEARRPVPPEVSTEDHGATRPRVAPAPPVSSTSAEPAISVVVTHYERPELVRETLTSLATQSFRPFEVVLVDDGSPSSAAQRSLDALENDLWPFDFRIIRQSNAYLGAARNAGIAASRAPFVIFMDDDNVAFPNMIESLHGAIVSTEADIVTSQMLVFRKSSGQPDLDLLDGGERWAFTAGPAELGLSINCYGDATGIYRRDIFARIGGFHEWHGIGHEDWHLHARANLAGLKQLSLPVPLFWYRRVDTGMLNTTDRYANNRIIWDLYRQSLPANLSRFVDLAIRNDLVD